MPNGKRFISMRVKFMGVLCVTAASAVVAALILIPVALHIFRSVYMKPSHVDERLENYISRFAEYVAKENVRSDDTVAVVEWTRLHRSVYLSVGGDATEQFGAAGGELWQGESKPNMEPFFSEILSDSSSGESFSVDQNGTVYAVRFADGIASVAIVDYSYYTGGDLIIFGGILLAVLAFFIVIMIYYHRQTRAIVALSRAVEYVSSGSLHGTIQANRNDEIGRLAQDVDTMRNTLIEKMQEQEEAWQANSDLLTSMTHDIRTPLTTLLGYMELLSSDNENMTEEQCSYIRRCVEKTEQIKGLSDKLFLYFWAYNRSDNDEEWESFETSLLFEQWIGEYIPAMEMAGLTITTDFSALCDTDIVRIRTDCLRRVTDNIFDNMTKYADRNHPVVITATRHDLTLMLRFENHVGRRDDHTTSTRIGVKTCQNMMDIMRGTFETEEEGRLYAATLRLPLENLHTVK